MHKDQEEADSLGMNQNILLITNPIFIVKNGFLDYSNKIKSRNTVDYKKKSKKT